MSSKIVPGSGAEYVAARFDESRHLLVAGAETAASINRIRASWDDVATPLSIEDLRALGTIADAEFAKRLKDIATAATQLTGADITVQFGYLPTQDMNVLSGRTANGDAVIFLDEFRERFLFGLSVNRAVGIFAPLSVEEREELRSLGEALLSTHFAPSAFFEFQDSMRWTFEKDEQSVLIGFNISRAILCFVLAHEVSHIILHHRPAARGHTSEFEADLLALKIVQRLVEQREHFEWAGIPPEYDCAALIFFEIEQAIDRRRERTASARADDTHPDSRERSARVLEHGKSWFSQDGLEMWQRFKRSMAELRS